MLCSERRSQYFLLLHFSAGQIFSCRYFFKENLVIYLYIFFPLAESPQQRYKWNVFLLLSVIEFLGERTSHYNGKINPGVIRRYLIRTKMLTFSLFVTLYFHSCFVFSLQRFYEDQNFSSICLLCLHFWFYRGPQNYINFFFFFLELKSIYQIKGNLMVLIC